VENLVTLKRDGQVALLTLNRPEVRNALSLPTLLQLCAHLDALEQDPDVRVVLLTGAGDKAFCAGADLKERRTMTEGQTRHFVATIRATMDTVEACPKPVIALINGVGLGGGCELALAADIRIMAEGARLGLTEVQLGIIPGAGGTQRLPRLVGKGRAKEMILTGRPVEAREALLIGLCERVVPPSDLRDEGMAMAKQICRAAPLALSRAKWAIDAGSGLPLQSGLEIEAKAYELILPTEDRLEALQAFQEKRPPVFKGK